MALAVFFLLLGTLAAEVALFGLYQAALVGAVLMALCALTLALVHHRLRRTSPQEPTRRAAPKVAPPGGVQVQLYQPAHASPE